MDIEQTLLSNDQWVLLLKDMPNEDNKVIPWMLREHQLFVENASVCDLLLGGLLHAHVGHMMLA